MSETTGSQATPTPDNTHWGVAYLREDLQDLHQQITETNKRIESRFAWLITTMVALTSILSAVIKL